MPTTDVQRTIETIEREIVLARSVYLAADANAIAKETIRNAAIAAADKALVIAKIDNKSMAINAVLAADLAAKESFNVYFAAYDAYQAAYARLRTLRSELAILRGR